MQNGHFDDDRAVTLDQQLSPFPPSTGVDLNNLPHSKDCQGCPRCGVPDLAELCHPDQSHSP